jgi:hypothetical protein
MGGETTHRLNWRLPVCGSLGAVIAVLPTLVFGNDIEPFLATAVLGAIVAGILFAIFFVTVPRHTMAALSMVVVCFALSWLLFEVSGDLRTTGRWLIQSGRYKAEVLAQPNPVNGELKHAAWDGWGFAGMDTVVYLVFDPNDSLAAAAKSHSSGKYSGIPCEVHIVRRLERQWYTVLFYTDTDWDHCSSG